MKTYLLLSASIIVGMFASEGAGAECVAFRVHNNSAHYPNDGSGPYRLGIEYTQCSTGKYIKASDLAPGGDETYHDVDSGKAVRIENTSWAPSTTNLWKTEAAGPGLSITCTGTTANPMCFPTSQGNCKPFHVKSGGTYMQAEYVDCNTLKYTASYVGGMYKAEDTFQVAPNTTVRLEQPGFVGSSNLWKPRLIGEGQTVDCKSGEKCQPQ